MNKDLMSISTIETYLHTLLGKSISNNVFVGTIPEAVESTWKDMVLIDCNQIFDLEAKGQGSVLIWLYAKPLSVGRKNLAALSKMEKAFDAIVKEARNPNYSISKRYTNPDYNASLKWHCNIIELIIQIY